MKSCKVTHGDRGLFTDGFDRNISQMQYGRQNPEHIRLKLVSQSWWKEVREGVEVVFKKTVQGEPLFGGL